MVSIVAASKALWHFRSVASAETGTRITLPERGTARTALHYRIGIHHPSKVAFSHEVPMSAAQPPANKRRRVTKACDFCHRRGRKCHTEGGNSSACSTCIRHGVACTWDRVAAKRGAKPRNHQPTAASPAQWHLKEDRHGSHLVLQALVDVFFEDIYPMSV